METLIYMADSRLITLENSVSKIEQRLNDVEGYTKQTSESVKRIETAILGDEEFGQKGFKHRIEDVEGDVETLKDFKKKIIYWAAGAAGGATGIVQFLSNLIEKS
jgi:hypothetical protein